MALHQPFLLRAAVASLLAFGALGAAHAQAEHWPSKPVRLIASFPPGTPGDVIARLIQPDLQKKWGQTVVVESKTGAGGNLGAAEGVKATDDHTLVVGPDTVLTINPHVYKRLNFDLRGGLKPVTYFASFNQMLVCNDQSNIRSLADFIGQKDPTKTYGSGGPGTPSHMAMAMLLDIAGTQLVHIPFKGPGPAAQAVLAGHVDCSFTVSSVVLDFVKNGRLKPLAVSGQDRSVLLPDVPTVAESGFPGFDATFFETLMAPVGMNQAVVEKIQQDVKEVLSSPALKRRLADMDLRVEALTPQDAERRRAVDAKKWGEIAAKANLQLD